MSQCIIAVGCKQSVIPFPAAKKMELPFDDRGKRKGKAAEPSSSSSPPRTIDKPRYDVFLSFRGEDTRKGFTSHLYNALCQRGISTFIDSEELERGERIEELFNYIEASKIFVPVLSKGYANSRWCLREITKMVECRRLIIPIFFHIDPKDVRKQSGPFQLDKSSKGVGQKDLSKWKDALRAVGEISGYSFQNDTNENEAHLIQNVVEQISRKLNKNARPITEHIVGMDSHIEEIYRLLDLTDKEVKMVGIVGMGGVGKTTIATVVYNKLLSDFDFEDSSFISNVREGFKQYNGGGYLQKRLIKDILKEKHPDVADVERGKSLIKDRFEFKKVLVILDDADQIEQLKALAGERDWFGPGSRIIITSRDSGVLLNHGVKEEDIYKPELLDDENSLKLFISHAFPVVQPTESEYVELAMKFVQLSGRLPLALTVFGSLVRRRNIKQWKEILQKLQKLIEDPKDRVGGRLRISYDGLEENVKQIFLDISCFLIGEKKEYAIDRWLDYGKQKQYATYMWEDSGKQKEYATYMWEDSGKQKEYATYMWEDCGLCPETAIAKLQERSLININERDEFEMHDLLRDMGRGIAQQGEHWQWSRLRNSDDLLQSLKYKDKPRMAEGIVIKRPDDEPPAKCLSTRDFVDFSCLRLLHLDRFAFKGEFLCLPERLKWLKLSHCQFSISVLQRIPKWLSGVSNFNAISILELIFMDDVDRILMEITSSSRKAFDALNVLNIEDSQMTRTPDFSKMKMMSLRKLTLQNCWRLKEVDGSIGSVKSLVHLDLQRCFKLQRLPDSICTLMSLETLMLIGCKSLSYLPEKLGDIKSLRELRAENTSIRAIPDSIGHLSNLRTLFLIGNYHIKKLPDSMKMLDSLEELYLGDPFSFFNRVPFNLMNLDSKVWIENTEDFEWLAVLPNSACEKVKELKFRDDSIQELPPYLGRLTNIEALSIHCKNLRALPEWPGQLQKLKSFELESDSLEALPATAGSTFENLRLLKLKCCALKHVPDWIASVGRLEKLSLRNCRSMTFLPTSMTHLTGTLCHLDLSPSQTVPDSAMFFLTSLALASGCLLRTLDLSNTKICCLPSSLSNLSQLQELCLEYCENLQSLPLLPSSLLVLNATDCNNLRTISDVSNLKSLKELKLGGCSLLGDFCGLESIAHNLETLELPGPFGGLSSISQLSPAFMTRVFKGAAFSSFQTFIVSARRPYGKPTDDHQPFWITFPKVGRGGKRPDRVTCSFFTSGLREELELSISIVEEDGRAIYQSTTKNLDKNYLTFNIRGEEIAEFSGEGNYLKMQVSAPTSILKDLWRHLRNAFMKVDYT